MLSRGTLRITLACAVVLVSSACLVDTELGANRPTPRPEPGVRARVTHLAAAVAGDDSLVRTTGTIAAWQEDALSLQVDGETRSAPGHPPAGTRTFPLDRIRLLETYKGRPSFLTTSGVATGLWGLAGLAVALIAECGGGDRFDCSDASAETVALVTVAGAAIGGLVWAPIVWVASSPWGRVGVGPPDPRSGASPPGVGVGVSLRLF